jgi:tetratricopeptide (TPR) repeat protein/predicted Ser/Thr protein kinase
MESQRWQQVKEVCQLALEREPSERRAFVAARCGEDEQLRQEVESLLLQATASEGLLAAPVWQQLGIANAMAVPALGASEQWIPDAIGRYRVLRLIGEGGMGVVYEAEQDHPRRVVALKVIRPGLASADLLRRFERESQALGRLQHPGIAQVYEAGTADSGVGPQPYFAMEFIAGEPLKDYVHAHGLTTRQRMDLVARICDAVQHAHERGLVHRDLKPSNILVDRMGQPKVLDFGVARLVDGSSNATRHTELGELVGTLAYMSPEQVVGDPIDVDGRSDVYALGVILYELLAGRMPYVISKRLHEAVQTIREADPTRLRSISRAFRGDVETIVSKALEKDKARRYPSAAALASDIRRYQADEPIEARPASTVYQLKKFSRRHKGFVIATAAVIATLVVGIAFSTRAALRAREAEQMAQAVNDFLRNDLLAQASTGNQAGPQTPPDPDLKVRTALDRAAARIAEKFGAQPSVEASIRETIGQTYMDLGMYPEAATHLTRAQELNRRLLGLEHQSTLRTSSSLGRLAQLQAKYPQAEALLSRTLDAQRRVLGLNHPDTLLSMNNLGIVYWRRGKFAQAETLLAQALGIRRRVSGPDDRRTLWLMLNLAGVYDHEGKYDRAEALDQETLAIQRRVLGPEHPDTLITMNNLGVIYFKQGKYAQAEALDAQTLDTRRRLLGREHIDTLMSMTNLANTYAFQGKYAEAEALESETFETQSRVLGPEHSETMMSLGNLADTYELRGKHAQAAELLNRALQITRRVLGPDHPDTLNNLADLGFMYERQGKHAAAESYVSQALVGRRRALGPSHPDTLSSVADLAQVYHSEGKFAKSETLAREAVDFMRKAQPDDWQRFRAESLVGAALAGQKRFDEAEPLLLQGYRGMADRKDRMGPPNQYYLDCASEWMATLYEAWGRPDKASQWRQIRAAGSSQ